MAIMVEWEFQDNNTFLVIFHLFDDFYKPNLRAKLKLISNAKLGKLPNGDEVIFLPFGKKEGVLKPYITWAPSHPEVALMAEVLLFANIINGLPLKYREMLNKIFNGPPNKSIPKDAYYIYAPKSIIGLDGGCILNPENREIAELNESYVNDLKRWTKPEFIEQSYIDDKIAHSKYSSSGEK